MPPSNIEPVVGHVEGRVRLAYEACGAGETVIFLHGVGADRRAWRPQLPVFGQDFRAVAWDARGYHGSHDYSGAATMTHFADDVVRLLDHLDCPRAHVVGQSMGGLVAQHLYAQFPDRVSTLVLANTTPSLRRSMTEEDVNRFLEERRAPIAGGLTMADLAPVVGPLLVSPDASPQIRAEIVAIYSDLRPKSYLKALEMVTRYEPVLDLTAVRVPVLVLAGRHDRITPPAAGRALVDAIPTADYVEFSGSGHMTNLELPDLFNEVVLSFLKRNGQARQGG